MKATTLFMLLGLLPSAASATCQIEFEVQGDVNPDIEYTLTYDYKLISKNYDIGKLTPFQKVEIDFTQCPEQRHADLTLHYVAEGVKQLAFETRYFPQQKAVVFSHANTLAYRSCVGCKSIQYGAVIEVIKAQAMDKELGELIAQQADYLNYDRYADVRAVFGDKVRTIVRDVKELAYIVPPNIGVIENTGPSARDMTQQWLNVLLPNKAFGHVLKARFTNYPEKGNKALQSKVEQISDRFFSKLFKVSRGVKSAEDLSRQVNTLLDPLRASTDQSIVNLVSEIESALEESIDLNQKISMVTFSKGELNQPTPDMIETIPANWFRLLHTIPAETPEQLAMFSDQFRADFLTKIQNRDDSLEPYIAAAVKKYGKAMRYASMGSTNKDKAAYNALIAEIKGKETRLINKLFSLIDIDAGYEIQWIFEHDSWKLDRFILL
ncbi:hypothetical protein Q4591_17985 [Shewanella sp. 3_MG-2023]|uniref:hypothetical protein n=1 Tax=Shewanella sp. 3_MG-2023 TaxID=3062635 RepID=UPI0026E40F02|nr:hypothetical protein [Shewanella sp. 3_MG-2023]MDO6777239.1 hypothetical protein [Shewanella sp. 3_MG-2023]